MSLIASVTNHIQVNLCNVFLSIYLKPEEVYPMHTPTHRGISELDTQLIWEDVYIGWIMSPIENNQVEIHIVTASLLWHRWSRYMFILSSFTRYLPV